ncbi:hypothetical protein F0U44_06805 [Nocardioides humilatus]|uniref:Uncharacterized protein n=2 Tax=Nocardioides humilatus TaxID=2607660 RepID=A0A5B1LMQ6_9ACTN|nr:hypothetical protein F0U44_06805 [Nocardioides humilatus]
MEQFAASIAALQRPPGLPAATWAGVVALAHKIRALPAHPSTEDIEAVEEQLTADQREAVEAAADWFRASCGA